MPWGTKDVMSQRVQFVAEVGDGVFTVSELCRRYEISRKTAYKWLGRGGDLTDRSRRPRQPTSTDPAIVERILQLRRQYGWGPRKLRRLLENVGVQPVPARATIALILKRHGAILPRRRRARGERLVTPHTPMSGPNVVWTADFKGEFRTGDGRWCYPLTLVDGFSRYLLACHGLAGPRTELARPVFERVFRRYGLPTVLRTDNGEPFASPTTIRRLSRLTVWWIRLGIQVERIAPGRPDQNGRHERFHRSLLAAAIRPLVAPDHRTQQRRFGRYRQLYNHVRPHEALNDDTPASRYSASPRPYPAVVPPVTYSAAHVVRRVGPSGSFMWRHQHVPLSRVLDGEDIGLLPSAEGLWAVYFGPVRLGQFDERRGRITKAD